MQKYLSDCLLMPFVYRLQTFGEITKEQLPTFRVTE